MIGLLKGDLSRGTHRNVWFIKMEFYIRLLILKYSKKQLIFYLEDFGITNYQEDTMEYIQDMIIKF